jgi:hypothetical protein
VFADEEVAVLGDVEVIDRLNLVGLNGLDSGGPSDSTDDVAGLEVAGYGPALAGFPEPVDAGGDDRLL